MAGCVSLRHPRWINGTFMPWALMYPYHDRCWLFAPFADSFSTKKAQRTRQQSCRDTTLGFQVACLVRGGRLCYVITAFWGTPESKWLHMKFHLRPWRSYTSNTGFWLCPTHRHGLAIGKVRFAQPPVLYYLYRNTVGAICNNACCLQNPGCHVRKECQIKKKALRGDTATRVKIYSSRLVRTGVKDRCCGMVRC